jgi:hypothetical protein
MLIWHQSEESVPIRNKIKSRIRINIKIKFRSCRGLYEVKEAHSKAVKAQS